jgi:hypothetical protein
MGHHDPGVRFCCCAFLLAHHAVRIGIRLQPSCGSAMN